MDVDDVKRREARPIERFQGLIEIARRNVPDLRRNAETLVPLRDGRALALLRKARDQVRWIPLGGPSTGDLTRPKDLAKLLVWRFSVFVLLPTAVLALYLFLIAADQYVAETRFAVRGNVEPMADAALGEFGSLIQKHNSQDSFIVRDFIHSRPMAETAEAALGVSKMFSRDEADFWARYRIDQPIEKLTRYWREHVVAHIDALSGVITLTVRAFRPEDAVAISKEVVARSETLVNEISRRAQEDMIEHAQRDADMADERLRKARLAMQSFRNTWGIIDPMKTAETTLTTIAMLKKDKLKAENDLRVLRGSGLDEKTRGIQVLVATVAAIDGQMTQLQDQLTTEGLQAGVRHNMTQALLEFEGLKIEQSISEKLSESFRLLLDRARVAAQNQQIYLATYVPTQLPGMATYPERSSALFIGFFCFFLIWSVVSLIIAGFKDARL